MPSVTCSIEIQNVYEDGQSITTSFKDLAMPAPASHIESDLDEWFLDHLVDYTGTGVTGLDAVYTILITSSSDADLVGKTYEISG